MSRFLWFTVYMGYCNGQRLKVSEADISYWFWNVGL